MSLELTTLFGYMDKISKELEKNVLVKDTMDGMLHRLDTTEISQEVLDKLLVEYVQYLVLSLLGIVIERASAFPLLEKEEEALDADIALLLKKKDQQVRNMQLLEARRDKEQEKLSKELALLEMQIAGFTMNDKYNVMVNNGEMISLFSQTKLDPTQWMKDVVEHLANDLG